MHKNWLHELNNCFLWSVCRASIFLLVSIQHIRHFLSEIHCSEIIYVVTSRIRWWHAYGLTRTKRFLLRSVILLCTIWWVESPALKTQSVFIRGKTFVSTAMVPLFSRLQSLDKFLDNRSGVIKASTWLFIPKHHRQGSTKSWSTGCRKIFWPAD